MFDEIFNIFVVLFVVVDPIGLAPIFVALTHGSDEDYRQQMARRSILISAVLLVIFALLGNQLLGWLGISIDAFRIAGGFLLFLLAIDMVFARQSGLRSTTQTEQTEAEEREDISVFPLAIPLVAGPGSMTTLILMLGEVKEQVEAVTIMAVLFVVLIISYLSFIFAARIMTRLGETGINVISRVLGILLAALAVQFMLDGIRASLLSS
jgi:multiple antibiotic resistance protein